MVERLQEDEGEEGEFRKSEGKREKKGKNVEEVRGWG